MCAFSYDSLSWSFSRSCHITAAAVRALAPSLCHWSVRVRVCVCVWMLYASARTSQHKTALQFSVVSWILKRQQSDWLYENETRNVTCTVKEDYGCRQSAFAIVEEFYTTKTTLFSNHAIHTRSGPIFHFLCRFMQTQRIGRRIIFLCWCIPKCSDWSDQQPTWVRKI